MKRIRDSSFSCPNTDRGHQNSDDLVIEHTHVHYRFRPYTIGLTGGIASGKTKVAEDLR